MHRAHPNTGPPQDLGPTHHGVAKSCATCCPLAAPRHCCISLTAELTKAVTTGVPPWHRMPRRKTLFLPPRLCRFYERLFALQAAGAGRPGSGLGGVQQGAAIQPDSPAETSFSPTERPASILPGLFCAAMPEQCVALPTVLRWPLLSGAAGTHGYQSGCTAVPRRWPPPRAGPGPA